MLSRYICFILGEWYGQLGKGEKGLLLPEPSSALVRYPVNPHAFRCTLSCMPSQSQTIETVFLAPSLTDC